jgi:hypothetical protein
MLRQRIAVDRTLDDDIRLNGRCHGRKAIRKQRPSQAEAFWSPKVLGCSA